MSDTNPPGGTGAGSERLRETAEEARHAAAETWDEAKREARERAEATAEEARRRAESEAERGKSMGADQAHQWARALDRAAAELGPDTMQAQLLRQTAEGLDDLARSVETRSVGEMIEAVADFGRRNPLAFVGGAMIAGFALSRFATASRPGPEWEEEPASRPSRPTTPEAPGAASFEAGGAESGQEEELRLTDSMRPEGGPGPRPTSEPGTASAPTGTGRPYPSAGPVPSGGEGEEDER